MRNVSLRGAASAVLTLSILFIVLFWRLGTPTFWDPDEAHYAETTRELIATGDWWAPYFNEQPFFDKPVLFHQLQAITMQLTGDPEFGARLLPALASLGLIAVTYWFAARTLSRRVAGAAALILATNPGVFALSRYAILDTLFTLATFGGAAALGVAVLRDRPGLQWIGYFAIAVGVLVKGPLSLVLCGLAFLVLIAISAELRRRLHALHWIAGALLIVLVAAPYLVYLFVRFGQDFVNGYLLDENVRLFTASRFANQPGYAFYFQILAVGMLPWTAMLVGRLVDDARSVTGGQPLDLVETMLWAWAAVVVFFFTLSTFKLDHYIFPAAPALSVLCARAWTNGGTATRIGRWLVGPLLVASGVAIAYLMLVRLALPAAATAVPATMIALGTVETLQLAKGSPGTLPVLPLVALTVTYAGVIIWVMPALEVGKVIPDIAAYVARTAGPTDRVASFQLNRWTPAFRFYVGRHTTFLDDPAQAAAFFAEPQPFYVALRGDAYERLVASGAPLRIVYERQGTAVTSGRALWRVREPQVRYVVAAKQ